MTPSIPLKRSRSQQLRPSLLAYPNSPDEAYVLAADASSDDDICDDDDGEEDELYNRSKHLLFTTHAKVLGKWQQQLSVLVLIQAPRRERGVCIDAQELPLERLDGGIAPTSPDQRIMWVRANGRGIKTVQQSTRQPAAAFRAARAPAAPQKDKTMRDPTKAKPPGWARCVGAVGSNNNQTEHESFCAYAKAVDASNQYAPHW
ncbi:hypothetical protein FI667_g1822, partial [Globisporangium splendens]